MDYSVAHTIFQTLLQETRGDEDAKLLLDELTRYAVEYARLRTDWWLSDRNERMEMDQRRTSAHNTFISSCDVLARYLKTIGRGQKWREALTQDRKEIGDFACWVHAMLGIAAR